MNTKLYLPGFFYLIGPLLFVPVWAYMNGNWLMLFGILASYFGSLCYVHDFGAVIFALFLGLLAYCVLIASSFSIHDIFTTLFLCMLYGFVTRAIYSKIKEKEEHRKEMEDIRNGV